VGPIAVVTIDNGSDYRRPTVFNRGAFESLDETLARLRTGDWRGLLLTGKPFVFAAGADIDEFPTLTTPALAREAGRAGHDAFARIRELPFPTLAAVNGAALGGGVEIALHCDLRTISRGVRHFACPEVMLGIIPGWGGTQLIPRLVGVETAVRFIVSNPLRQNRMLTGEQAFEAGFADALLDPVEFVDESMALLVDAVESGVKPRSDPSAADAGETLRRARLQLDDTVHGAAPAPYRALDLIEGAASWSI
jgi:enoyl-CoA hydratase/carnithine racemase